MRLVEALLDVFHSADLPGGVYLQCHWDDTSELGEVRVPIVGPSDWLVHGFVFHDTDPWLRHLHVLHQQGKHQAALAEDDYFPAGSKAIREWRIYTQRECGRSSCLARIALGQIIWLPFPPVSQDLVYIGIWNLDRWNVVQYFNVMFSCWKIRSIKGKKWRISFDIFRSKKSELWPQM